MIQDNWKEHLAGFHTEYDKQCSECYKENRVINAHKVVNSHEDMLEKHPALRNAWGSNYPLGYRPE